MLRSLACTLSLMKWMSISICLVLEQKIRFLASSITLMLLHHIVGLFEKYTPISRNKDCNQIISEAAAASALYSLLANDLAITICLLENQEIKIDFLSSKSLSQQILNHNLMSPLGILIPIYKP